MAFVLSVLQFMDSDYPFGIFKLFCQRLICIEDNTFIVPHGRDTLSRLLLQNSLNLVAGLYLVTCKSKQIIDY